MSRITRVTALVMSGCVLMIGLVGCMSEKRETVRLDVRQAQLEELIRQADTWGEEIISEMAAEDVESVYSNHGGVRILGDLTEEWPKLYYWAQSVDLYADGSRSTIEFANDLEPWLEDEGWVRNRDREFPPGAESFTRDYFRDGYHLMIEVFTEAPPKVQTVVFRIVTPPTGR